MMRTTGVAMLANETVEKMDRLDFLKACHLRLLHISGDQLRQKLLSMGVDGYTQADLGSSLVLKFFTRAELQAAAASATSDLVVELPE